MSDPGKHIVAVVGGAVSGSVAAEILANHGVDVVVFEQNDRPYGKIEDGLPRWHVHQRKKEYQKIDARLNRSDVRFLPRTKLGRDLSFADLCGLGFSAVLLANGAWRDRPFPVEGVDDVLEKGFWYQNPLIYWFNHKEEANYDGPRLEIPDGAVIFGGGLASIDVVKVCQLENYGRAFRERGIDVPMIHLEKKGVPKVCAEHGLEPAELGVKGCTLLYRRRGVDMPLAQPPPNATPEQREKTIAARQKLLKIAQDKFLFHFQERTMPKELLVEDGHVRGVVTLRTEVEGRRATPVEGSEETLRTDLIVSSIGSVAERIPGIEMTGESYAFTDWDLGVYGSEEGVFGVGNVVTGKGNIRASLLHSQEVSNHIAKHYLGVVAGENLGEAVKEFLDGRTPPTPETRGAVLKQVEERQAAVGYTQGYEAWIRDVTPADLE